MHKLYLLLTLAVLLISSNSDAEREFRGCSVNLRDRLVKCDSGLEFYIDSAED